MERDRDWVRLGRAFAEARKKIPLSQVEVGGHLHVSRTPIQAIERGRQSNGQPFNKVTGTMRAYARLVGWTEDSVDRVLGGGEPEQAPQPVEPPPTAEAASDLPPDVALELRSGKTLGSTVMHIGPESADARVIVVLKGDVDITEDELEALMRDWRKKRRHLQGVAPETETPQDD